MTAPTWADRSLPLAERVGAVGLVGRDDRTASYYDALAALVADVAAADRCARAAADVSRLSGLPDSLPNLGALGAARMTLNEAIAAWRRGWRMAERAPLAGWRNTYLLGGGQGLCVGPYLRCGISHPLFPPDSVTNWSVGVEAATGSVNPALGRCMSHDAARFAAEDAARALVAEMATALGGRVVWAGEPEGGE